MGSGLFVLIRCVLEAICRWARCGADAGHCVGHAIELHVHSRYCCDQVLLRLLDFETVRLLMPVSTFALRSVVCLPVGYTLDSLGKI